MTVKVVVAVKDTQPMDTTGPGTKEKRVQVRGRKEFIFPASGDNLLIPFGEVHRYGGWALIARRTFFRAWVYIIFRHIVRVKSGYTSGKVSGYGVG